MNKNFKTILIYFWKLLACSVSFTIGMAILGITIPFPGHLSFVLTEGSDVFLTALWLILTGMILTLVLSFISSRLRAGWLVRWGLLAEITWISGAVLLITNGFFDPKVWSISQLAIRLFSLFSFLLPSLILAALVAILFPPQASDQIPREEPFPPQKAANWIARVALDVFAPAQADPFANRRRLAHLWPKHR